MEAYLAHVIGGKDGCSIENQLVVPKNTMKRAASTPDASERSNTVKQRPGPVEDAGDLDPEQLATMTRSERKRYREKKRRSDVNKGCGDLVNLLVEIDPEVRNDVSERLRRAHLKGHTDVSLEDNLISRTDLIGYAVKVLRRVHAENEGRKAIIDRLLASNSASVRDSSQVSRMKSAKRAEGETEELTDYSAFPGFVKSGKSYEACEAG